MVSTRVCGTLSSGSNPDRHPILIFKNNIHSSYVVCLLLKNGMDLLKQKIYKYIMYPLARVYWKLFNPQASGARALIILDNEVLLIKNLNLSYWTMPGGGIDRNENPEQCIVRELKEELDLSDLIVEYKLGEYQSQKEGKKDAIYIFICRPLSKEYKKQWEIEDAKWFSLDELPENISPATVRRIGEYRSGNRDVVAMW